MGANRSRTSGFDALKGLAILAVVAIHALATGVADLQGRLVGVAGGLLTWSVPTFVAVAAGFAAREPAGRALGRRVRRLLPHYISWTAAYVALAALLEGALRPTHQDLLSVALLGGAWYHLWFIPALVQVLVLVPVLRWVCARPERLWPFLVTTTGLLAAGPFATRGSVLAEVLTSRYAVVWLPVAVAGIGVECGSLRPRHPARWIVTGLALLAVESLVAVARGAATAYARASFPVLVAGALAGARHWARPPGWLVALGRLSLGIYLVHPAVLEVLARVGHLRPYPVWAAVPVALAATFLSAGLTQVRRALLDRHTARRPRHLRSGSPGHLPRTGWDLGPLAPGPAAATVSACEQQSETAS